MDLRGKGYERFGDAKQLHKDQWSPYELNGGNIIAYA